MSQDQPSLCESHGIKIFGRSFPEGDLSLKPIQKGSSLILLGTFRINLKKYPEFRNVDLKGIVHIFLDNDLKPRFSGYVKKYQVTDEFGIVDLQDITLRLEYEKITALESLNLMESDILALLTQSSGLIFTPPPGLLYDDTKRDFVVIIPVKNLTITENFKIGNVEFYHSFKNVDDSIIRKSKNGTKNPIWSKNLTRAKTIVKAKNFFDAIITGYSVISTAIDIIALRTDFSFPSISINSCQYDFEYSYQILVSKVKIPTSVYCRENNTDFAVIFDIEMSKENVLTLNANSKKFFKEMNILCDDLLQKNSLSSKEKNLLQALHWLRKAIQEGNNKDKFLDLWIAFELLISGEKSEKRFNDGDMEKFSNLITNSDFKEQQKSAIISIIKVSINSNPLLVKFDQVVQKLKIAFSTDERATLSELYDKRNDLVHGRKDIEVSNDELDKMRTIIEKIFIGKMNALKLKNK
jgi:mevalonate kinase